MKNIEKIIRVSRGHECADLVLKNVKLVNVFSEEIYEADIAITEILLQEFLKDIAEKKKLTLKELMLHLLLLTGMCTWKVPCFYLQNLPGL